MYHSWLALCLGRVAVGSSLGNMGAESKRGSKGYKMIGLACSVSAVCAGHVTKG